MKVKFLDLYSQYLSIKEEIDNEIKNILINSSFIGGSRLTEFENSFADYSGVKNCVGVGNGTDALEIAIESLNLPDNSEILVPANSFIASSEAVTRTNKKVIFVDIDPQTYLIDLKKIEAKITNNTSAIIAVHLYGHPCDMNSIKKIAQKYNLKIIEDCAQAHGASINNIRVGGLGDIAAFSFYPGKNLGAYGDGGCVLTNSDHLAIKCRLIANHGRHNKYDHLQEGRNSRLDTLQASILKVKLKHLDDWIEKRNQIANIYFKNLKDCNHLVLPKINKNIKHAFHLFVIRTTERDSLQKHLKEKEIQTGIHYPISLPMQKAYQKMGIHSDTNLANKYSKEILSLPIGEHLRPDEVEYVCTEILDFFN